MEELLRGKTVLMVGRDYFFYTREIAAELRRTFGAAVRFVPIEPPGLWYRILKKAGVFASRWLTRYHRAAIAALRRESPDIVLFIQVHQIGDLMSEYRAAFPAARFVLYYWDSLRTHDYLPYVHYFDRTCTFDPQDCRRTAGLDYLPLFYCERFRSLRSVPEVDCDVSFVGAAVSLRRYEQLEKFRAWARANGVSLIDYLVVSPFLYCRMLLRGRVLRHVHFRPLRQEQLLRIYGRARSILDLPNNPQSGYTMRTFESLGAHRKLITTNHNIVSDDLYTPESVFVLGVHGEFPTRSFLASPARFSAAVERYSLPTWIRQLLGPVLAGGGTAAECAPSLTRGAR
jgi:hypothetical protein